MHLSKDEVKNIYIYIYIYNIYETYIMDKEHESVIANKQRTLFH